MSTAQLLQPVPPSAPAVSATLHPLCMGYLPGTTLQGPLFSNEEKRTATELVGGAGIQVAIVCDRKAKINA